MEYDYHLIQQLSLECMRYCRQAQIVSRQIFVNAGVCFENQFVLRVLLQQEPLTVPQLAKIHGVMRQHMSGVVSSLVELNFVELLYNPRHKRSKLIRLTEQGRAFIIDLNDKGRIIAKRMEHLFDPVKMEAASEVVKSLRNVLEQGHWKGDDWKGDD